MVFLCCAIVALQPKWITTGDKSHMTPHNEVNSFQVNLCSMKLSLLKSSSLKSLDRSSLMYLALVLLCYAQDIETNPGPRPLKYPCQICHKAVKWTTPGVCCDSCELWYHKDCMCMNSGIIYIYIYMQVLIYIYIYIYMHHSKTYRGIVFSVACQTSPPPFLRQPMSRMPTPSHLCWVLDPPALPLHRK